MYWLFSAAWPRRSSRPRRSPPAPPPRRWVPLIRSTYLSSESEAALARTVSQCGDSTVVLVAGPVEDDLLDAGRLGPLGEQPPDLLGLGRLVTARGAEVGLHGGGGREGPAGGVVDDLGQDVPGRPGHDEPRTLGSAEDLLARPDLAAQPRPGLGRGALVRRQRDSHHLPAFPTLRRTFSPAYRTPLPLYGSGLRSLRMFAATSPTCCLSMPITEKRVGASTLNVMPSGAVTATGWL